uniref:Putative secreted protein n=1 Tax=Anopheles triannulatus TaxID=58253 RepID=A0A2M4B385_9DIPT
MRVCQLCKRVFWLVFKLSYWCRCQQTNAPRTEQGQTEQDGGDQGIGGFRNWQNCSVLNCAASSSLVRRKG